MPIRLTCAAFVLACAVLAAFSAHAASPAVLKSAVAVTDNVVTLGDLFTPESFAQAPEAARVVISAAPRPGERLKLDAYRLTRLCAEHGLEWSNAQKLDTISVERVGDIVPSDMLRARLLEEAAAQGLQGRLALQFSGALPVLHIPAGAEPSIAVDALDIDPRTGQFRARLRAPASDMSAQSVPLTGRLYAVTDIPVLTHDMRPGDVIHESDFEWAETPAERLGQNVLTSAADIAGTTPKRMLRAGQPIRIGDIAPPVIIAKGDLVAMTVSAPGMSLTAQGRALDAGGQGDTIRVMNVLSKRTIEGTIKGPGEVVVGAFVTAQAVAVR